VVTVRPPTSGDKAWRCLGPEDVAVIEGEIPPPGYLEEKPEPGKIGEHGGAGDGYRYLGGDS
jgi:hypothetical protein